MATVSGLVAAGTLVTLTTPGTAEATVPPTAVSPVRLATAGVSTAVARPVQLSGASGAGSTDGTLGRWRGTPVTIGGAFDDTYVAQIHQYAVQRGGPWGRWNGDLDVAVGAIYANRRETWAAAARGVYDARWATALTNLKKAWGARTGTLHIRFAHEFNGTWTPWMVRGVDAPKFVAAWKRFRVLQRRILPRAKLVFCPNDGTSAALHLDWRKAFPGRAYVDEMSVDSYNQYPFVTTVAGFRSKLAGIGPYGAPLGIERHRIFARLVGLPMGVSEWGTNASMGDGSLYIRLFHAWLVAHAGRGPGQIPYEILYNDRTTFGGVFGMFPTSPRPRVAATYRAVF